MELSTTNGHINIDYLFIYLSHLFSCGTSSLYHGKVPAPHGKQLVFTPTEAGFLMDV